MSDCDLPEYILSDKNGVKKIVVLANLNNKKQMKMLKDKGYSFVSPDEVDTSSIELTGL